MDQMPETITTTQPIPLERVADLLCCGFEGGSYGCGYWCRIMDYEPPTSDAPIGIFTADYPHVFNALRGGVVICRRYEEETDEKYTPLRLDAAAIARGLELMPTKAPKQWAAFLGEDEDATTGEVFIQLCLLGDVEYG